MIYKIFRKNININLITSLLIVFILTFIFLSLGQLSFNNNKIIAGAETKDIIVYADYYPWFNSDTWERGHSNIPLLGLYDSLDNEVLKEHSRLANSYGIDVFRIEYIPQMADNIENGILNTDLGNTKICLMYDIMLKNILAGRGSPPYNFDDAGIYNSFITDIDKIADNYFSHPNYFKINGRPVLWIYITRELYGNWKQAINQARKNIAEKGFDVYLIGDHIYYDYDYDGIELFDAVGIYSPYQAGPQDPYKLIKRMETLYVKWNNTAITRGVDFIPGAIPGYNDTCLSNERDAMPPFSCSGIEFNKMLKMVSKYLDNVNGANNLTQVSIATFNEHQEGSGIEPTLEWGYDRISQVSAVFGIN
jgi:hypothetical protein